jgi:hypothetical protein
LLHLLIVDGADDDVCRGNSPARSTIVSDR